MGVTALSGVCGLFSRQKWTVFQTKMLQEIEVEGARRDRSHWTVLSCLKCKRCEGEGDGEGGEEKVHLKTHGAMLVGVGKNHIWANVPTGGV